ncbi:hypothetical protein K458DRAFT_484461 [Lentithecium fluviatile CBS 122367]|uniref:Uncharacterized protein n=1 Tax=Lentithecium fluviatile CBS 122367 TaxID=1168545 RepID=A0A6G1JCX4_9PLEO|nr:hypothetical protein K458DRAFT_484461 [Lentithecium fluviatile CBS 122367]
MQESRENLKTLKKIMSAATCFYPLPPPEGIAVCSDINRWCSSFRLFFHLAKALKNPLRHLTSPLISPQSAARHRMQKFAYSDLIGTGKQHPPATSALIRRPSTGDANEDGPTDRKAEPFLKSARDTVRAPGQVTSGVIIYQQAARMLDA